MGCWVDAVSEQLAAGAQERPAGADIPEDVVVAAQHGDRAALALADLSEDWLTWRRTGIGGSEVAAVLGLDPRKRPIDVWLSKMRRVESDADEPASWGHLLEPVIADHYQRRRELCYLDGPFEGQRHAYRHWQLYSPDRLVVRTARELTGAMPPRDEILRIVEIKSRGWHRLADYGDEGTDSVPWPEACQVHWYISALDCEGGADIAVLFNSHRYHEYHVDLDRKIEDDMLAEMESWWYRHVVACVEPSPDGSDSFTRYLRDRFASTTAPRPPTVNEQELLIKLRAVRQVKRFMEKLDALLCQRLCVSLGDSEGLILPEGKLTYTRRRGNPSHKAVAEELAARLEMGKRALAALQDQHRSPDTRVLSMPRSWGKHPLTAAIVQQVEAALADVDVRLLSAPEATEGDEP